MVDFGANKREFNTLTVDEQRGTITKSSTNTDKLRNELDWYLRLPDDLHYCHPRILDYSKDKSKFTMDLLPMDPLNKLYLSDKFDEALWSKVFVSIGTLINDFSIYYTRLFEDDEYRKCLYEMYVNKTIERLQKLTTSSEFVHYFIDEELRVNGIQVPNLTYVLSNLSFIADRGGLYSDEDAVPSIIHGDLCLSNILYDKDSGFIRVIDPRGSFGYLTISGDPRYELAKLSHSFDGNYDLYINGEFDIRRSDHDIELVPFLTPSQRQVQKMFHLWIQDYAGPETLKQIKLIQALLFLSMVPLHSDRPKAQQAFLAQGLLDIASFI